MTPLTVQGAGGWQEARDLIDVDVRGTLEDREQGHREWLVAGKGKVELSRGAELVKRAG